MDNYNTTFFFMQLPSSQISSDPTYQRPIEIGWIRKIAEKFDPNVVNPIKVSLRDGHYYVFDGQHTLATLKYLNGGQDLMVPCLVYRGLTRDDEAILFAKQTGISHKVEAKIKTKAQYTGNDPQVLDMIGIVKSLGFDFDFTNKQGDKKIIAVATLNRMYQRSSRQEFIDSLEIIRDAWHFEPYSLKSELLGGVNQFYIYPSFRGKVIKKLAIQKLSAVKPIIIYRDGKAYSRGGDLRFAKQIADIYNHGLKSNRLPGGIDLHY